ncbi:MAG: HutD family protein [Burkholderiaceae bacterium]
MLVTRSLWQKHADSVAPSAWRNGAGQTREMLRRPAGPEWQLRISLADISRDGPFSAFPGTRRWFGVAAGTGVSLHFGTRVHSVTGDNAALHFDGAAAPRASLLGGPTRALNLMVRKGAALMIQVQADRSWGEVFGERGLFTLCAGSLCSADGAAVALPASTLVWHLPPGPCRFETRAPGRTGWWLGWSRESTLESV